MHRFSVISRLFLPLLLLATPAAAAVQTDRASESEVEALRIRVQQLEGQNARILAQLSEIQELLVQTMAAEGGAADDVRVATTGIAPPSSVARALESALAPGVLSPEPIPQTAAPAVRTEGNGSDIGFYGFVRIDAIFDDSRANNFQAPTAIRSEPADSASDGNFVIHPRLTRFGMNFRAPDTLDGLGGARLSGRIETDFQNGGRESRAIPRMRHAFLELDWDNQSLLAGQTSDLISPLFPAVNADTLMWNAGNLGDRRTQVRYGYSGDSGVSFQAGIGLTGAVDPLDVDGNGIRDGEAATMPNFQGRVAYTGSNLALGVWSHYARLHTDLAFGGKRNFNGYSYGMDLDLRFSPRVNVRGEAWAGSNLGDMRGGIGQSIDPGTGREIDSRGGWVELGLQSGPHGLFAGFTIDDPRNGHVPAGGATENRAWYLTNRFNLAPPLTLGIDYIHWRTHYSTLPKGTDNRVDLYLIYGF